MHFTRFAAWSALHGTPALPATPHDVRAFIRALPHDVSPLELDRYLLAIAKAHVRSGREDPTTAAIVRAARGAHFDARALQGRDNGPRWDLLYEVLAACPKSLRGSRNYAMVLLAYGGHLSDGHIAAMQVEHVAFTELGLVVLAKRIGRRLIPRPPDPVVDPAEALSVWMARSHVHHGHLFRQVRGEQVSEHGMTRMGVWKCIEGCFLQAGLALPPRGVWFPSKHAGEIAFDPAPPSLTTRFGKKRWDDPT